jgi:virginiamycin B lyase
MAGIAHAWTSRLTAIAIASLVAACGVPPPPSTSGVTARNAGQVAAYDPETDTWREWPLPGDAPQAYAVFVDETDAVWLTDFGANAIVRFDSATETFTSFVAESQPAEVRQLNGRPGEVWGAESAADQLVVVRTSD